MCCRALPPPRHQGDQHDHSCAAGPRPPLVRPPSHRVRTLGVTSATMWSMRCSAPAAASDASATGSLPSMSTFSSATRCPVAAHRSRNARPKSTGGASAGGPACTISPCASHPGTTPSTQSRTVVGSAAAPASSDTKPKRASTAAPFATPAHRVRRAHSGCMSTASVANPCTAAVAVYHPALQPTSTWKCVAGVAAPGRPPPSTCSYTSAIASSRVWNHSCINAWPPRYTLSSGIKKARCPPWLMRLNRTPSHRAAAHASPRACSAAMPSPRPPGVTASAAHVASARATASAPRPRPGCRIPTRADARNEWREAGRRRGARKPRRIE